MSVVGAVQDVLFALQRWNPRVPGWTRRIFRRALNAAARFQGVIELPEDWSAPLIAGGVAVSIDSPPRDLGTCRVSTGLLREKVSIPVSGSSCRCLLVTSSLDVGGMDEVVYFLARRLPFHGVSTAVLHVTDDGREGGLPRGRLARALLKAGVETVELGRRAAALWMERSRPDVISAHGPPTWVLEAAESLCVPVVETLHGMHSLFGCEAPLERARSKTLSKIVAVSELVRRQYLELNSCFPSERIITIPNGVDDWRRIPGDRKEIRARLGITRQYVFVSLARHCLQKNTFGLVDAFSEVAKVHPLAHLVIAGRPDDRTYFAQVARLRSRLPCRDRIHLRDHTPDPAEALSIADGFVLDSFFEGWSLASMEALFAGVPVVLSEVGGALEQVGGRRELGFVVGNPAGDPLRVNWREIQRARFERQPNREEFVQAMDTLVKERDERAAVREEISAAARSRFDAEVCLRSHAEVLLSACVESR